MRAHVLVGANNRFRVVSVVICHHRQFYSVEFKVLQIFNVVECPGYVGSLLLSAGRCSAHDLLWYWLGDGRIFLELQSTSK